MSRTRISRTAREQLQSQLNQYCADSPEPDPREIERLVSAGASPNGHPLLGAAALGRLAVLRSLLAAGAKPDGVRGQYTPLQTAAEHNQLAVCEVLLQAGARVDFDPPGPPGVGSPLIVAALNHSVAAVRLFASRGADLNHRRTCNGTTALSGAVRCADAEMVHLLLELGADPLLPLDATGRTVLDDARELKSPQCAQLLQSWQARRVALSALPHHAALPNI